MSGKLFVGGLSWVTTEESLKAVYQEFGEVSEVQIMRDRTNNRPRGFGFVTYADPAVANKVSGQKYTVDGREVETKLSVPRDQIAPGQPLVDPTPREPPCVKIFLGGIGPNSTDRTLVDYFSKFGEVQEVLIMKDRNTGVSRGFGFCTFVQQKSAAAALKESRSHEIDGKTVEIKPAESRESCNLKAGKGAGGKGGGGYDGVRMDSMYDYVGGPMRGASDSYMRNPAQVYGAPHGMFSPYGQGYPAYQQQGFVQPGPGMNYVPPAVYADPGQQPGYAIAGTAETWNAGYGVAEQIPPPPSIPPPPPAQFHSAPAVYQAPMMQQGGYNGGGSTRPWHYDRDRGNDYHPYAR